MNFVLFFNELFRVCRKHSSSYHAVFKLPQGQITDSISVLSSLENIEIKHFLTFHFKAVNNLFEVILIGSHYVLSAARERKFLSCFSLVVNFSRLGICVHVVLFLVGKRASVAICQDHITVFSSQNQNKVRAENRVI